jgi:signal transduction histidine kinase
VIQWLRDLPIRRKLTTVIAATSAVALVLASGMLLAWDVVRFRADLRDDLETLTTIIADNTTASLEFNDPGAAAETLGALEAKPQITAAGIYRPNGELFAAYQPTGGAAPPGGRLTDGLRDLEGAVEIVRPIVLNGKRIGTIYVRSSLAELYQRLRTRILTVALVLVAAWLLTFFLSSWLQRLVADPLLRLADTARAVSAQQNYALRATPHGKDEIGVLVNAFNDMLSQIQRRDAALLAAKDTLEHRVAERTGQLSSELTERQRAERELEVRNEELEQTNRELDDFAYIASHDLKEPLRGIHNYSRFLIEDYADRFDEDGRAKLETLTRLSRRMETLIDSLLHYSRLGRTDLALDEVDVQEVVEDVVDRLGISLREQNIEVRIPRRLPVIQSDRVRLGEVFANLITNAIKYNDKPQRWIEIGLLDPPAVASRDAPREHTFYVRDNGIGIPERHLDTVFRIFKRLHGRDEFGGGTGAGLTIVRKIVERHHGRVWIESTPGEGTTVFFTLGRGTE